MAKFPQWGVSPLKAKVEHEAKQATGDIADAVRRAQAEGFDPARMWWRGDARPVDLKRGYDWVDVNNPVWLSSSPELAGSFAGMMLQSAQLRSKFDPKTGGYINPVEPRSLYPHWLAKDTAIFDFRDPKQAEELIDKAAARGVFDKWYTAPYFQGQSRANPDEIRAGMYHHIENPGVLQTARDMGYDGFFVREVPETSAFAVAERGPRQYFPSEAEARVAYDMEMDRWKRYGENDGTKKPRIANYQNKWFVEAQDHNNLNGGVETAGGFALNLGLLRPDKLRLPVAEFNPANRGKPNLLGGAAGATLAATMGAMTPEEAEAAAQEQYLNRPQYQRSLLTDDPYQEVPAPRSGLLAGAAMRASSAEGPTDPWWWAPSGLLNYMDNLNYGRHNRAGDIAGATLDVAPLPVPALRKSGWL
jgi:hypothetical protein